MRRLLPLMVLLGAAVGCGGSGATGAAGSPTGNPSVTSGPTTLTQPSCPAPSTSWAILGKASRFDKQCITVPANESFTITFTNADAGVQHNVTVHSRSLTSTFMQGKVITGVETITYQVDGLEPGVYLFHCDVHPTLMSGTLRAGV